MKKFIAISDIHSETKYIKLLYKFFQDFNPDYFIINGDSCDFDSISSYNSHKIGAVGYDQVISDTKKEIEICKSIINNIHKYSKRSHKIFIEGNHDDRYNDFFRYNIPNGNNFIPLKHSLGMDEWEYINLGRFKKIGKLYFMHGEKFNGDAFVKTCCLKMRKNIRLGHHHTNQTYMITSPLDSKDIVECKSIGCLCSKDPHYLKGITNRWINSFLVGYLYDNGNYQDFTINIIKDKFIAPNGKLYN